MSNERLSSIDGVESYLSVVKFEQKKPFRKLSFVTTLAKVTLTSKSKELRILIEVLSVYQLIALNLLLFD